MLRNHGNNVNFEYGKGYVFFQFMKFIILQFFMESNVIKCYSFI